MWTSISHGPRLVCFSCMSSVRKRMERSRIELIGLIAAEISPWSAPISRGNIFSLPCLLFSILPPLPPLPSSLSPTSSRPPPPPPSPRLRTLQAWSDHATWTRRHHHGRQARGTRLFSFHGGAPIFRIFIIISPMQRIGSPPPLWRHRPEKLFFV